MMMKTLVLTVFTLYSSFFLAQQVDENGILGDYDGNGTKEYAFVKVNDCGEECDGKCETIIYFSDETIKTFIISPAKGGTLYNLKDLNNDGKDDLGFYPNWCTSCWHPFYTYKLEKGEWKPLVAPISTHCAQWEDGKFPIRKNIRKKGYVIVTSSKWLDDDIKMVSENVKVH